MRLSMMKFAASEVICGEMWMNFTLVLSSAQIAAQRQRAVSNTTE